MKQGYPLDFQYMHAETFVLSGDVFSPLAATRPLVGARRAHDQEIRTSCRTLDPSSTVARNRFTTLLSRAESEFACKAKNTARDRH